MMTFKLFTDAEYVLEKILQTCKLPQDKNSSAIVVKSINVIRYWIEHYYIDFEQNQKLLEIVTTCAETLENKKLGKIIQNCIEKKVFKI
jgi:hypothetical protein